MNIKPRIDATNLKIDFFRNKIRHKLLPLIEKDYSPNIKELLSNLAELLEKDYSFLELKQKKIFKRKAKIRKDTVIFSLADFKKEHISAQRSIARTAIECLKGNLDGIDYRHWNEIEELAYERPAGSIVHLPDKIEVIKTKTVLKFLKSCKEKTTKPSPKGDVFLDIPGATAFGRRRIRATILKRCNYMKKDSKRVEYFDMDKVRLPLKMRLRRKGDKMAPLGMNSYKKLSDIFIDEKVPFKRRSAIPLVTSSDGEIIWLCGIRISDKCKILPSTKTILKLELL
jgi:tRNA(Ile)-lysidine synthase